MSEIAIRVQNLGKMYQLGRQTQASARYSTLRDTLTEGAQQIFRRNNSQKNRGEEFWALRDINFEVNQGEVLGIIGRNGAGKSTLLKILSRITEPTTGKVHIKGRVASLLEVGTGFHPELTGRENIYLNGAILGMSRVEIKQKFNEIAEFAEVEKFLDTPVKRYSNGMYVRLAFAVAAHLDPEILVIDEVLAVGDTQFQRKCLGKINEVSRSEGKTVLFVSHNMTAVTSLCSRAMVLKEGRVEVPSGPVETAVGKYLAQLSDVTSVPLSNRKDREGEGRIRITGFTMYDKEARPVEVVASGQFVEFCITYESAPGTRLSSITTAIGITSVNGSFVTLLSNGIAGEPFRNAPDKGTFSCAIERFPLSAGTYSVNLIIRNNELMQDWIKDATMIVVEDGDFFGTGRTVPASHGGILVDQTWKADGKLVGGSFASG